MTIPRQGKIESGTKSICFCLRPITFERYGEDGFEFWRDTDGFVCIDNHWHRSRPPAAVPVPEEDWSKVERIEADVKIGWPESRWETMIVVRDSDFNRLLAAYTKLKGEIRL